MTPPLVCLLRTASGHWSTSTGKERDTEPGNDYFEARYYSSAKGRFTSPDFGHSSRNEHRDHTSDGRNQYLYDAEGRICAVHDKTSGVAQPNTEYIYNADGTRVAKGYLSSWPGIGSACPAPASGNFTLTRQYLLDSGADQVTELNGSGAWQH